MPISSHEGYPCVFWQDYYNWGLGQESHKSGIEALARIHEDYAGGATSILYADDDLYIMQRSGSGSQKGLLFVLNNRGDGWNGTRVKTIWGNTKFVPEAWRGSYDAGVPREKWSQEEGWADFWAPPRGYAVYVPQG